MRFEDFIGSSHQALWFCEVRSSMALRGIEDAKSRTKWISDYRAFPNCDVEWGHEYLAPPAPRNELRQQRHHRLSNELQLMGE